LAPPLALRLVGFCSSESVERFTPRATGSSADDALLVLRLTDVDGSADAATADAATADAAVACLAREFFCSRLASAACCFAAAAAAAACCFAAAAAASCNISSSKANLAAGSHDANLTLGHTKSSSSSLACRNGQSIFGQFGLWRIGVHSQLLKIVLGPMGSSVIFANKVSLIAGECIAATDAFVVDLIILTMAASDNDNLLGTSNSSESA